MATVSQFESELKTLITVEIERVKSILDEGLAIKDYADYKYHLGQVHALRRVHDSYCEETKKIIEER